MTPEQFVANVMSRLPLIPDPDDFKSVARGVIDLHSMGFSTTDAVAYSRLLEEVNPELDETYAITQMERIMSKYDKKGQAL